MSEEDIKELIRKRGSFKGRMTLFWSHLNKLKEPLNTSEVCELELRLRKAESLYDLYDEVQLKLECLVDDVNAQMSERSEFETSYYQSLSKAQGLLLRNKNSDTSSEIGTSKGSKHKFVKLPTIQLPKFSGSYDVWLEFHDTFCSLIHSNDNIANIDKFHYLRASLEGTAALVIQSIEFSAKNYDIAWRLLCERFENKRLLIQNHVSALFNIEPISKESASSLKRVIDELNKNLRSLESLGEPTKHWDTLLIYIIANKLDTKTYREWEELKGKIKRDSPITLNEFTEFMRSRADLLETLEMNRAVHAPSNKSIKIKSLVSVTSPPQPAKGHNTYSSPVTTSCPKCKGDHYLYNCSSFLALTNEARLQLLFNYKICRNCLRSGHYANNCKRNGCKLCRRNHHTLVHVDTKLGSGTLTHDNNATQPTQSHTNDNNVTLSCVSTSASQNREVLLSTALVKLYDYNNKPHIARALLDSGSTSCLLSETMYNKLNLPSHKVNKSVIGINNATSHVRKTVCVTMKSLNESYCNTLSCFVLPSITNMIPSRQLDLSSLNIPNVELADPNFNVPAVIDLIIGADVFWDLLGSRKLTLGVHNPVLYETSLGWLVSGPIFGGRASDSSHFVNCHFTNVDDSDDKLRYDNDDIQNQLSRFWQLEEVSHKVSHYSAEEQCCEQHFVENTTRLANGRFCVRVPVNQSPAVLGNSLQRATHCLLSLEKRFNAQASLKRDYCEFMSEYLKLGHMSECQFKSSQFAYFIPHHGVVRESSCTTKLRVVFNASSPTSSGVSLNSIQMVGPTIQDDLMTILLRFRQHKYVLAADIEKMYRQVMVHPDDRHLQQIVWRDDPSIPIKIYQLNTVTYGTASAPFLAIRCLKQIGIECKDCKLSDIIQHDFYVDDLMSGGDSLDEVLRIKDGVTAELESACMKLRKWKSNAAEVMSSSCAPVDLNIGNQEPNLTLGLNWRTDSDDICFSIKGEPETTSSKRSILSSIAKIFDPLGLLSPCVISMKIMLQKLWLLKVSWDDTLPPEVYKLWKKLVNALPALNHVHAPRRVFCDSYNSVDLHVFSDASIAAYGACVYARSCNKNETLVRLICSKSRVAPIKPTTIPRLELCGALVGVRLCEKVKDSLRVHIRHITYWTDSTIVLGWLKILPIKLQTFVRNRVGEILEKTSSCTWRHVPTDQNPADLISRGLDPNLIQTSKLWWSGPPFLTEEPSRWPSSPIATDKLPETKTDTAFFTTTETSTELIDFNRFSNFSRLKRCVAYMFRFIARCKKQVIHTQYLSDKELSNALTLLIKLSQMQSFPEYDLLLKQKPLLVKSPLLKFNVFLDDFKIIRVGGRLENSEYSFSKKHPILIQSTHLFTKLLFNYEHKRLLHAAPQLLLACVKENYWPIGGRNLAKKCYYSCTKCNRFRGKTNAPIMGNLPKQRLAPSFPFENVGIDYAGPLLAASRQGRGCRLTKVYIAIFVCFTTKAIHLELVGDLSSDNFLTALKRFMSRRGKPSNIYSDNGTSFVGAYNDIGKFLKSCSNTISETVHNEGINFHFSPPYAPHFGGLWEAGVKSTKFHLRRVLGNCNLTYEELNTVLVQIEAILNSRPLTALSTDPNDLMPLTPAHFLVGRSLTSLPTPSYGESSASNLNRYQRIEQLRQHFWIRWSKEYVSELQQRVKWKTGSSSLKIDTMVLLKEDHLPPLKWKLGRIVAVYSGSDGINRVADVRTAAGIVRRPFSKICCLFEEDG